MATELMEINPRELKFIFEVMKQSSCSIQLVNKTNHYLAFKVKTTSPKKYCVRPNIGVLDPKASFTFAVTMQAQKVAPTDLVCKDKFLVQCAAVPEGTADDEITSSMFAKEEGKLVEENKLKVILLSAQQSPVSLPMNGTLKQTSEDEVKPRSMENIVETSSLQNKRQIEDMHVEPKTINDAEKTKLLKELDETKQKLMDFESKLREAEFTIAKLTEGRRGLNQEKEIIQQELATMRSTKVIRKVQVGFPLLFVGMVAIVSIVIGYLLSVSA
ncbi:vesicle-associated protein 1-2-like [Impatiens glandulifera]|uniref:vesicle-associated protein 1-2-like n=1 Tax=Impatiens glandulifera TaxID=253017 RepID=UPI001FB0CB1C|nr:vesicle-associated protein 1-2-like [Impatiens glandulifera]